MIHNFALSLSYCTSTVPLPLSTSAPTPPSPRAQLAAELQEKVRVLENEIEILRTSVENKERLLQKCALVQGHKVMERDTLRQDFGKQVHMQTELSAELEQQVMAVLSSTVYWE